MESPPPLQNEELRLRALREYQLLDTLPEQALDDLTALAAQICETPISLISLIDEERQWFKSRVGLTVPETSREISFCGHTIAGSGLMVIPDAAEDARFADNPLVKGDPKIRFYAGVPLISHDGCALGALCVIDRAPRELGSAQLEALEALGRQAMAQLELRRQTSKLCKSERFLRAIFDSEPECVKVLARDGSLQMINQAGLRMVEADSFEQVANQCIYPLVGAQQREAYESLSEKVFRGESGKLQFEFVGLKGAKLWLETHAAPLRDDGGKVTGLLGITRDITERKLAENALRANEEKFQNLFESSPDAIFVVSKAGGINSVNRQAERMFGYAREELLGRQVESLLPGQFAKSHVALRESYAENPHTRPMGEGRDLFAVRKDGAEFPVGISLSPITTPEGEMVIATVRDFTERKSLEEQFRQSQKMEAIGQLAGGVAHDFNNILTVIQGYGSLLLSRERTPKGVEDAAAQIVRASEHAANLTRQLLTFSRRQTMNRSLVDLNEIVGDLTRMLQRILGEDILLRIEIHRGKLQTFADAGMLDQALLNLVVNARDAMPDGGQLSIETGETRFTEQEAASMSDVAAGEYVVLRVRDTGEGIEPEHFARIFEPFFTTKEQGKGTGLGLATIFGIVKQHEGAVTVESDLGKGTTFQVFLPASESPDESPEQDGGKAELRGGSETILLVEDDEAVRMLTRTVLERGGYRVLEAENGVVALEVWAGAKKDIALLITDIVMPKGVNGRDLARQLQAEDAGLPVVFTSGYSVDFAGGVDLSQGQVFMQKPCPPREMLEIVRQCLDGSRQ